MKDTENDWVANAVGSVKVMSIMAAQCAITAAYWTDHYREPGQSISDIDDTFGSLNDIEDPLLTAHRLAKFYLISAGDCVNSMCKLMEIDHPNFVGSAALARSAAEHASRSMYLSDTDISHHARLLRVHLLMHGSLHEYKSSHDAAATEMIAAWDRWKKRINESFKVEFERVPRQKMPKSRGLIKRYFAEEGDCSYEALSRPIHGNATWLSITVVQEQKGTAVARITLMRNAMFAARCVVDAVVSLAKLWGLNLNSVAATVSEEIGLDVPLTWDDIENGMRNVAAFVRSFNEGQFADTVPTPQPRR